jgi:two-component system OmpR family sensor kinase
VTTAGTPPSGLNTVSLRFRVTVAVIVVLTLVLIALAGVVDAVFSAQSEKNLNTLLTGRVQLARQLARSGVGPQQLINRVDAEGVRAHLVLRNGAEFGAAIPVGDQIKSTTVILVAAGRVSGSQLTLTVDTALVNGAKTTLRRALLITGLAALALSGLLVTIAVRFALLPLSSMAALARTIADGQRGRRLGPTRTDTELGQTASAFDDMLDELEGAEARARKAEEWTRAFLADAAHELRTPIAGVQAAAETLLHQSGRLHPEQREHLEVLLIKEAQRAGKLVSDLLATARLDAGVDLDLAPVALGFIAQSEVERARMLYPAATISLAGPNVSLVGDPAKISGIVRNVIDNALRASGRHGTIAVQLGEARTMATLEVTDSGPGVPAADRERIFERLVRLDASRNQDGGGFGLGLAIARGYARAHGGDLTCEDAPSGALFRLTLPRQPPRPPF